MPASDLGGVSRLPWRPLIFLEIPQMPDPTSNCADSKSGAAQAGQRVLDRLVHACAPPCRTIGSRVACPLKESQAWHLASLKACLANVSRDFLNCDEVPPVITSYLPEHAPEPRVAVLRRRCLFGAQLETWAKITSA